MIIGSRCGYPGSALSNFAPHPFVYDGVECNSMEGFLQSVKFDKPHIQVEVCKLVGMAAKSRGSSRNKRWQSVQTLWWKGCAIPRRSEEYQILLRKAYRAMYEQSESFRKALDLTKGMTLKHPIGHNDPSMTVLTEKEFCKILTDLRDKQ